MQTSPYLMCKVKQSRYSGAKGSRKLRSPDFVTRAQDVGKVVSLTHRPPLPQEMLLEAESTPGP